MSAINAIVTPNAAFMIADGLCYNEGKVIKIDAEKTFSLRGMRAAVGVTGNAKAPYFFQAAIEDRFSAFDEVVAAGSEWFVDAFEAFADKFCDGNSASNVVLIGWLEKEDRPAAFAIDLVAGNGKWGGINRGSEGNGVFAEYPIIAAPAPSSEQLRAGKYPFGEVDPRVKLLRLLEIQRRMPAADGKYCVGGQCTLTTVTCEGVEQRVVHAWDEDNVGEPVVPLTIDWDVLRAERERERSHT